MIPLSASTVHSCTAEISVPVPIIVPISAPTESPVPAPSAVQVLPAASKVSGSNVRIEVRDPITCKLLYVLQICFDLEAKNW